MIRSMEEFTSAFRAARSVSTPLVAIRTADPASTTRLITEAVQPYRALPGVVAWDMMRGIRAVTKDAGDALANALGNRERDAVGPADALLVARELPEDAVLIYANAHRFWNEPSVMQGIWNLRDAFKVNGRLLVLLASPGATLPAELAQDVLMLDEPLPSEVHLERIVKGTFCDAGLDEPDDQLLHRAIDALMGLAAFPAEQTLAMALVKGALDPEDLWERKRQIIEQTPGLSVWRGGETFDDLGGLDNVKRFLKAVLAGIEPPRVVVFIDEIEKAFAGTGTDLSGVKTEMAGTMLTWMQDHEADGLIFIGPPGACKSAIGKATGNTAGIPTIAFDLTAMESSLVGASGDRLRTALKVVEAVSQERALFIATCNSITSLPPELRRRFTLGTFFFDLPTAEEREAIWEIYFKRYSVSGEVPNDQGWTGAEIKECCRKTYRLKTTLVEASEYIVPVSRSAAEPIKALRQMASGKFISASKPGVYRYEEETSGPARRMIRLNEPVTVLQPARGEA
ncbi:MAG TPA: AAA family ATPase [Terriglobia bacterium]|nr:AAA family ATPase [Terriglobia bacterium]